MLWLAGGEAAEKRWRREIVTHIIRSNTENRTEDPVESFVAAIAEAGLPVPQRVIPDGQLHRYPTNGKSGDKAGFYALHLDGVAAGHFGCWRNGIRQTWSAHKGSKLNREELDQLRQSMEAEERHRRKYQAQRAEIANSIWESAKPASSNHPYLMRKGIQPCGDLRQADISEAIWFDDQNRTGTLPNCLLVSVEGPSGIQTLEAITPRGDKLFMAGGQMKGGYHVISGSSESIYVVEGWATGASVHAATGATVAVSFTSGALLPTAKRVRSEAPGAHLVIAGDNDRKGDGSNPGRHAAEKAADATGGEMLLPEFADSEAGSDWNDYHAIRGLDALRDALVPMNDEEDDILAFLEQSKAKHLLAKEPPPQRYVVDGLIPEPVAAAIVAPGSTGKSYWLMQLAASVTTGMPFMGRKIERPGSVLMFGAEDSKDEMSRRLHSIVNESEWDGCRLDSKTLGERYYPVSVLGKDNRLTIHDGRDIVRHEERISRLIRMAKAIPDLRMIIIDPVSRFRSGDENDNEAATRFVEVLEQIREETGVTVLCAHHSRKGSTGEDVNDIRGASAFVDALRFAATLAKPQPGKGINEDDLKNLVRFSVVKSNYRTDVDEQWMRRSVGGVLKPIETPKRESVAVQQRSEDRYQEVLPRLKELIGRKAESGDPLTRSKLRRLYGGKENDFGVGKDLLEKMANQALEERALKLHEDGTLHLW
ncbi:AAA family ATPase [Vreelandella massiliensis]|uniref:AAA family ATPase n=1 Tax=Vreelandella massiliensis TaxID=1816686 RepID=UPI00096A27FB|nr:AAA family ATPase [Halomonas massiliensis]